MVSEVTDTGKQLLRGKTEVLRLKEEDLEAQEGHHLEFKEAFKIKFHFEKE